MCSVEVALQGHHQVTTTTPFTGTKGRRIVTYYICYICYLKKDSVDKVELMRCPEVAGNNNLYLCRYSWYEFSVSNYEMEMEQSTEAKSKQIMNKIHVETLIASGKYKGRKIILIWC